MLLLLSSWARAGDVGAGKALAEAVCAACHGLSGVSVSDAIPNLAAQKPAYLEAQLKSLKEGSRRSPLMNPIAGQLTSNQIADVAAYFGSQPGAPTSSAKSEPLPRLMKSAVTFPDEHPRGLVRYHTLNFPATRQVRHYYANAAALVAAREGRPLPDGSVLLSEQYSAQLDGDDKPKIGNDGFYQPDQLLGYSVMARQAGWGSDLPDLLRNDDWNYAVFTPAKQRKPGVNQAECMACHKPQASSSFTFTLEKMKAATP